MFCVFFLHPFGSSIVGSSAKLVHTATLFIVCQLHVCNLSPVPSKQCNADIMPGLSRIMCQCYGGIVRDASPTHWLESHLASVCLITFWRLHLIFLTLPPLSPFALFWVWEQSPSLSEAALFSFSAVSALNAKLITKLCTSSDLPETLKCVHR